ncbi:MAG: TIGR03960 family B12-binding radical SAM protein [Deferrisomatales bacterium]|nr:TIGR03960 family B12-binding radical SAM protein [Deferrisomatales bacterium]
MRYGLALLEVERPGRYEGLEAGAVVKDWDAARVRVALCFPDLYEIGMSHLGLPLLYHVLNRRDEVLAERAYAPWGDMEALLRRRGWPLVTRESGRPLREFDLVGFTLPYELLATNLLAMLELGGVPLLAKERGAGDPLVLGGGPVAANPEPLADFFDAFFVGEAEEGIVEVAETLAAAKASEADRAGRLAALGRVPGVYVPSATRPVFRGGRLAGFEPPLRVRRRVVADLETAAVPERPLVPFVSAVHERLAVELARGCTRGCRFCQAGYLYRPVRERSPERVAELVARGLAGTGFEEVGLLSLSTGDYCAIGPLLVRLMDAHSPERVAVSLPSLRVDSLEPRLLEEVGRVRKTGFTVAPEAGTDRLRRVVNKNVTEEDVLRAAERVFGAGWKALKLYFMVGLPTETREDWAGIVDLVRKVARLAPPGRGRVGVSLSNFVPKAHTPFQWCRQLGPSEVAEAQEYFHRELARERKVELKWHSGPMSALEGVFARGDRRVGAAVLAAYRMGCRMDGWTERFRWDLWQDALAQAGLSLEEFLRERDLSEALPWDVVDLGVDRAFLQAEWERARSGTPTDDCRDGACQGCGLCDFQALLPRVAGPRDFPPGRDAEGAPGDAGGEDTSLLPRLRFRFTKTGPAGLLSHLETVAALHRALRAARVPLAYSQGHHPHPRLTLGPALPLGTESLAEQGEVKVCEVPPLLATQTALNEHLPEGLRVEALWTVVPGSRGLTGGDTREEYRVWPSQAATAQVASEGGWRGAVERFWAHPSFPVVKRRRNKAARVLDGRAYAEGLWVDGDVLAVRVRRARDGTALGMEDLVRTLAELPEGERACARIVKTRSEPA